MANNVNLLPHSPPAPFISSANNSVPQLIHPPPPQKSFQPQNFAPITHAPPAPPDLNVWRFPAALPPNAVPLVRTSANLYTVQPAPLINPHISTSHHSPHVQAAAGAQNYVTSDFMQANPFSSSTGTPPPCHSDHSANVWSYRSEPVVLGWPAASHTFGSFFGLCGFDKAVGGGNYF